MSATTMCLSVAALAIPAVFSHAIETQGHFAVEYLSLSVAAVMILLYLLMLAYSLLRGRPPGAPAEIGEPKGERPPSRGLVFNWALLGSSTALIAWLSEILVGAVEPVVDRLGWTEFFLGIILIPIVGNIAEHVVAVEMAYKNKMDLSLAVSLGSSMQVALLVAPVLVFVSLAMGTPMDLIFNPFELVSLAAAVVVAALISLDGKSNWLEGAQLLAVYLIIAAAFFFLPG